MKKDYSEELNIVQESMSTDGIEWLDELRKENEKSSQIR